MKVTAQYSIHNTKCVWVIAPGKRTELFKIYIPIYFYIFSWILIYSIYLYRIYYTLLEPRKINKEPWVCMFLPKILTTFCQFLYYKGGGSAKISLFHKPLIYVKYHWFSISVYKIIVLYPAWTSTILFTFLPEAAVHCLWTSGLSLISTVFSKQGNQQFY